MSSSRNRRHVPGPAGVAHRVRDVHELAADLLRGVGGGQFGGHGFDGGAQLGEGAQLRAAAFAGEAPADHLGIEGIPAVGRQHPDAHALGGFDQAERLQDAHGLADHRTGDLEFVFEVLGQHDVAGRELARDDAGAEVLNRAVVEAG